MNPHIDSNKTESHSIKVLPMNQESKDHIFNTIEMKALAKEWFGNVWINPPYPENEIRAFIDELLSSDCNQSIVLTDDSIDASWFEKLALKSTLLCFTTGTINYYDELIPKPSDPSVFYFCNNRVNFSSEYYRYALILDCAVDSCLGNYPASNKVKLSINVIDTLNVSELEIKNIDLSIDAIDLFDVSVFNNTTFA